MRKTAAVGIAGAVGLLVLAGASGCTARPSPSCGGGDVRLLQAIPQDLPGGGTVGFTDARADADPPTVTLMVAGATDVGVDGNTFGIGDGFTVGDVAYQVTCISASVVTLDAD